MSTKIIVRKATKKDIFSLAKIFNSSRGIQDFKGHRYNAGFFNARLSSKRDCVLVAGYDAQIIGGLNAEFEDATKITFLDNIAVDKKHWKKGVGGMLLRHLETMAKKRGHKRLLLQVFTWNRKMNAIMRRYRYRPFGKVIFYSKKL